MLSQFDKVKTVQGDMIVMCVFEFKANNSPKHNKLGGRKLVWLQDMSGNDVFFWDNELANIMPKVA